MNIQKSFEETEKGVLYVVPTPIGNLEDITYRALKILESAHYIAAEDTRNTKKLLNHFEIATSLISYHEHNKMAREEQLIHKLSQGESIAIVSDAGMPAISDPGYEIVQTAIKREFKVVVLPGANAALCALIGSGLPTNEFYFYGFLPRKKKEKETELVRLKNVQATLLFYESPYRLKDTLKIMKSSLGMRQAAIARELTKRFEEYVRGSLDELMTWSNENEIRGEFCIIVEGSEAGAVENEPAIWWRELSIEEHVNHYVEKENYRNKEAIKRVALDRNVPKREIYQAYHVDQ
ncbi:16S rRNA (cytidine(1402)-2'-O)-methyltransferase [Virgibacillus oceani]